MADISFSGVASGIDSASIIQALVAVERRPIAAKQAKKAGLQKNLDIFSKLGEKIAALRDAAQTLKSADSFSAFKATSGDTSIVTASASGAASAAVYEIEVSQLAKRETETSQNYANTDTLTVGTGTLVVTVGTTSTNVTINSSNQTLAGVRDAINASGAAVTASILNDGTGTPYRLVVTAKDGGDSNHITLNTSGLSGGTQPLSFSETVTGQDLIATVNGVTVHRTSNHVSDVVTGVTLDLLQETAANSPVTVRVEADAEGLKANVKKFVDAYNEVAKILGDQSRFTAGQAAPPLLGDASIRTIQSRLRSTVTKAVTAATGDPTSLGGIGVNTSTSGVLSIDDADLTAAIEANAQGVVRLFTSGAGNLAGSTEDYAKALVQLSDGVISGRKSSILDRISKLNQAITRDEARVTRFESDQRKRFAALEALIGKLQAQGQTLGTGFTRGQ